MPKDKGHRTKGAGQTSHVRGQRAKEKGQISQVRGQRKKVRHHRSEDKEKSSDITGRRTKEKGQISQVGGQKRTRVRSQKTEGTGQRGQRSEVITQRIEHKGTGHGSEVRHQRSCSPGILFWY